jgi:hypothetical protein
VKKIFFLLASFAVSAVSYAACTRSWVCDDYGKNCRVQQICENNLDLPGINLPGLTPMPSMELKPMPSISLPPLGTKRCRQMQVNGRWQNVCS